MCIIVFLPADVQSCLFHIAMSYCSLCGVCVEGEGEGSIIAMSYLSLPGVVCVEGEGSIIGMYIHVTSLLPPLTPPTW